MIPSLTPHHCSPNHANPSCPRRLLDGRFTSRPRSDPRPLWTASTGQGSCCMPRGGVHGAQRAERLCHMRVVEVGARRRRRVGRSSRWRRVRWQIVRASPCLRCPLAGSSIGYGRRVEAGRAPEWTLALAPASFLHPAHLLQSDFNMRSEEAVRGWNPHNQQRKC